MALTLEKTSAATDPVSVELRLTSYLTSRFALITLSSDPVSVEETFFAVLPVENRFTTDTGSAESDGSTVLAISQTVGRSSDPVSVAPSEMFKVSAIWR